MAEEFVEFDHLGDSRGDAPGRLWRISAVIAACAVLYAFYLRISVTAAPTSDGANTALQAWDILHGNVMLHGWLVSDVSFYTFELPVLAVSELLFGLHYFANNVAAALVYEIVTVCVVAFAMTNSRGAGRMARCGIAVAMLAMPLLGRQVGVSDLLGHPDHIGTSVFLLVPFLLIDRALSKPYTAPLLCVILCVGQLGDDTVRYVAVPAIVMVCGCRVLSARKLRTSDMMIALAAIVSVPLEILVRAVMRQSGAYLEVRPAIHLAPLSRWPDNAPLTLHALRELFGDLVAPGDPLGVAGTFLGSVCALAALAGLVRVIATWRSASRAEQCLAVAIVANIAAYQFTQWAQTASAYEMSVVFPCGVVLASRTVVPARIRGGIRARVMVTAAGVAALLPLVSAASAARATGIGNMSGGVSALVLWMKEHRLSYGLASYWNSSAITEETSNKIAVRNIIIHYGHALIVNWETNFSWFDPSRNDASFVVVERADPQLTAEQVTHAFGRPTSIHWLGNWEILIYRDNLLRQVMQYPLPPTQ